MQRCDSSSDDDGSSYVTASNFMDDLDVPSLDTSRHIEDGSGDNTSYPAQHKLQVPNRTLAVYGAENISLEVLEMFLENKKRSGGGEIEDIWIDEQTNAIMVTFAEESVAEAVLGRDEPLVLEENVLTVQIQVSRDPRSISVTGIVPSVSKDKLKLFFESRKWSGGGEVESIQYEQGTGNATLTFTDQEVAERVLCTKNCLKLAESILTVQPAAPSTHQAVVHLPDPSVVEVHGIDSKTDEETLVLFLENDKLGGGGDVESCQLNHAAGHAVVRFTDEEVAQRLIKKGKGELEDAEISFHPESVKPITMVRPKVPMRVESKRKANPVPSDTADIDAVTAIRIVGLTSDIQHGYLKLFLEASCGNEIRDLQMFHQAHSAIVKFHHSKDAVNVLKRRTLKIEDQEFHIIPLDTSVEDSKDYKGPLALAIYGIPSDTSAAHLDLYFSNRRRSGGYDVNKILWLPEDTKAIITFHSYSAVESVMGMHVKGQLHFKQPLTAEFLPQPYPPDMILGPTEPHKYLLKNVSFVSPEEVEEYFQMDTSGDITLKKILFSAEPGTLMIEFSSMPDYSRLLLHCYTIPLRDRMVTIQKVALPTAIQAHGVENVESDILALYFESPKIGGGDILGDIRREQTWAIIDFGNSKVVKEVLQHTHSLNNRSISVEKYYPDLGIIRPGRDATKPWNYKPDKFCMKLSGSLLEFLKNDERHQLIFETEGIKNGFCILWDESEDDNLIVDYNTDFKEDFGTQTTWQKQSEDTIHQLLDSFTVQNIATINEVLKETEDKLATFIQGSVRFTVDEDQSIITLIGIDHEVYAIKDKLAEFIKKSESSLLRSKEIIKEHMPLEGYKIKLMMVLDTLESQKHHFPDLIIQFDTNGLLISGLPEEIRSTKLHIYESVFNNIKVTKCQLPEDTVKLMRNKLVEDMIADRFQQNNVAVVCQIESSSEVALYGLKDSHNKMAKDVIIDIIRERQINITGENKPVLKSPAWRSCLQNLNTDYEDKFLLRTGNTHLLLTSVVYCVDGILEDVQNCLDENSILSMPVPVNSGVKHFINLHMKAELGKIQDNFKNYMLTILNVDVGYTLKASRYGLEPAAIALNELINDVKNQRYTISKPGMSKFFKSTQGKDAITVIQDRHKVVCELAGSSHPDLDSHEAFDVNIALGGPELFSTTILGIIVQVLTADMTKHKVDAVVNAANVNLKHTGGLAGAILKAGGQSIQIESSLYVLQNGPLKTGQVHVTQSGNLPCKAVIHAVGPQWRGGLFGERNDLYEAVHSCLDAADQRGFRSIAIPAISSGIYGFPLDLSTKTICDAVVDYIKQRKNGSTKEIHLMDNRDNGAKHFHTAMLKSMHERSITMPNTPVARPRTIVARPACKQMTPTPFATPHPAPLFATTSVAQRHGSFNPNVTMTPQGVTIQIKQGHLCNEQVHMLVNTTTKNLQLDAGGVSSSIVRKAGPIIQQECNLQAPQGINSGKIIVTSGGNLAANFICHGNVGEWDGAAGQRLKILKTFIKNSLNAASNHGSSSIAFPAIGTGNCKFPPDIVAKTMHEKITSYSKKNPSSSLKTVTIMLFPPDTRTAKAFEDYWASLQRSASVPKRPQRRALIGSKGSKGELSAKIGNVTLRVSSGDITQSTAYAIVNSTNGHLSMTQGAVSNTIHKAGGHTIEAECKRYVNQNGRVLDFATTGSGNLPCNMIYHLNARSSATDWENLICEVLIDAEQNQIPSIAFPALGTGSIKNDGGVMCDVFRDAITRFASVAPTDLLDVEIIIFDSHVFRAFKDRMGGNFKNKMAARIRHGFKVAGKAIKNKLIPSDVVEGHIVPPQLEPVTFQIFGSSQSSIHQAITALDVVCDKEVLTHIMDGEDLENIQEDELVEILSFMQLYTVDIQIAETAIVIEGMPVDVMQCISKINKILDKIKYRKQQEAMADILYEQVRWQYDTGIGSYQVYPEEINFLIEKAKKNKDKQVSWVEDDGSNAVIDFTKMTERQNGDPTTDVKVQRRVLGGGGSDSAHSGKSLPPNWTSVPQGQKYSTEILSPSDPEYQAVANKFTAGLIKQIERIQNPGLYMLYAVQKDLMQNSNNSGHQVERRLYHGTSSTNIQNINNGGFNRSYCGQHGVAYGDGVYFATDSQYSARHAYAKPDRQGKRYIYQSCVLTGHIGQGQSGIKEPPIKNPTTNERYDSVADKPRNPSIVVVFHDASAYPEYLITF